jgi:DNA repair protein RadC
MTEKYSVTIHEMREEDRPRERLIHYGPSALSNAELVAILLRTGNAQVSALGLAELLLRDCGGLKGLMTADLNTLQQVKGIGQAKSVEIAATAELGRRLAKFTPFESVIIRKPEDAVGVLQSDLRDERQEVFKALLLDTKNKVIKNVEISRGTLDSSLVHPREVFAPAVSAIAASIIVAHNHPSGDPTPSSEDIQVTSRLVEAGRILGIDVLDHLVIGHNRWVSLKERGLM